LPSNIFVQFMVGPTEISGGGFGGLLRLMGWITMAIAPVLLLLFVQVQFLPYHSFLLNQEQRMLLLVDFFLIWWLWGRALQTPIIASPIDPVIEVEGWRKVRQKGVALWQALALPLGVAASLAALIFSSHVASFPMEWERPPLAFAPRLEAMRASLTEWVFGTEKVFSRWPYNTLQLEEFNIFENLKLEDPDKLGGREFTVRLQERRLEGANLDFAKLGKADFREAKLQGATLIGAQLRGAWLTRAKLQGASLDLAQLQGALLSRAEMQGATLTFSNLQGGQLDRANIQGGALTRARLQGTTLIGAQFQGGTLDGAQLQGARLNFAQMQAATLDNAQLRGASFDGAQLQAASLREALVWRTSFALANLKDLMAQSLNWSPISRGAYEQLRSELSENIPTGEARTAALDRVETLDCKFTKGKKECSPSATEGQSEIRLDIQAASIGVTKEAYMAAISNVLRSIINNDTKNAIFILRGLMRKHPSAVYPKPSRLEDTGPNAPKLVDEILKTDSAISAYLSEDDKARLLEMKKEAEKIFLPQPLPTKPAKAK
jgi:uncharacterized protein YjbI with pentapeptide repeats